MFVFTLKESPQGVPAGAYTGVFGGIEDVPPNVEKGYGPGYMFTWTIESGPHAGQKACRIVSAPKGSPSPKNVMGRMLMAMHGTNIEEGATINPAQWVGKRYTVIVQAGPTGGTRVETVAPIA